MCALPPIADIAERDRHVRFVPQADIQEFVSLTKNLGEIPDRALSGILHSVFETGDATTNLPTGGALDGRPR
jgi:hypothetical protein